MGSLVVNSGAQVLSREMSNIFISYAAEDRSSVKVLAQAMEAQGLSVWWDRKIATGMRYHQVIEEALRSAKCVVVVWSRHSVSSDWVRAEAGDGLERNILVPVSIDAASPPLVFRQIQTADLQDWQGDQGAPEFVRLIADISRLLGEKTREIRHTTSSREELLQSDKSGKKRTVWPLLLAGFIGVIALLSGFLLFNQLAGPTAPAEITFFQADKEAVQRGEVVTLSWATKNADRVFFGIEPVEAMGKKRVKQELSTVYKLRAENKGSTDKKEVMVRVISDAPPRTP